MSSSRRRPERRLSIAQGRDAREIQLPPSAGKCFLLTSPFIERVRHIILRGSGVGALPRMPAPERRRLVEALAAEPRSHGRWFFQPWAFAGRTNPASSNRESTVWLPCGPLWVSGSGGVVRE